MAFTSGFSFGQTETVNLASSQATSSVTNSSSKPLTGGFNFGEPTSSPFGSSSKPVTGVCFPATSSETKSDRKPKKTTTPKFSPHYFSPLLENQWRNMDWSEEAKEKLMESVRSFKPASESVTEARVLLIGPVGAGKSSFISSVQSVFSGRVINRAMVGSSSSTSFTKKLRSFNIRGAGEKADEPTALVLCDVMGVGDGESTGLTLHDALSVIKGHAPEGHQI